MKHEQILALLDKWEDALSEIGPHLNDFISLAGCEGPLLESIYTLANAYTAQIAEAINWDAEALTDWWVTHDFGEKPMQAGLRGEPLQTLKSNDDLARFIVADLEG
jgi:hypothetical protein